MVHLKTFTAFVMSISIAVAQLDPDFATNHGCTNSTPGVPDKFTCQGLTNQGLAYEAAQRVHDIYNDPIYQVATNFSSKLKPGTILAVERVTDLTNYTIPSGLTLSRFQYTTTNLNGTVLPASAYVLWPYTAYSLRSSAKTASKIPFVAWSHGTSGAGRYCSPSNYQNLQYNFVLPYPLALAGFAVVAPDYAGLGVSQWRNGTKIPHAWLSLPSHANDIANAIIAARNAFPELTKEFVAVGHSQGGASAYAFAERQAHTPVSGYLGTVAIAPAGRLIESGVNTPSNSNDTFTLNLQPPGLDRWQIALKYGPCLPTEVLLFSMPPDFIRTVTKPGWNKDPTVQAWLKRVIVGGNPVKGPLLVIAGDSDIAVPSKSVAALYKDTCEAKENKNESLEMVTYQGVDHFPVIWASQQKWLGWVKDRFGGKCTTTKKCGSSFVDAPRIGAAGSSTVPNWLIERVEYETGWKASL